MAKETESPLSRLIDYFRSNKKHNLDPAIKIARTSPDTFMQAVKASRLFIESRDLYYELKTQLANEKSLSEFFLVTDIFINQHEKLHNDIKSYQDILFEFGYLDILCLTSLYLMKYAPLHAEDVSQIVIHGHVLSTIIQTRTDKPDRKKQSIDERYVEEKFVKYFLSKHPPKELEIFEEIVQSYKNLYLYETNLLDTYCHDDNYQVSIHDQFLLLAPIDTERHVQWYLNGQKTEAMRHYYFEQALYEIDQEAKDATFGSPENHDINKYVAVLTDSMYLYVTEQFGLDEMININNDFQLHLYPVLHSLSSIIGLYQNQFSETYLGFYKKTNDWWIAWHMLLSQGMINGQDRLPLIYSKNGDFGSKINKIYQIDTGTQIEQFWVYNLTELRVSKEKVPNIFEKPLIQIENFVFRMPWILAFSNPMTSFLNNLLRVHHNRDERQYEVHKSERNLAALFQKNGFIAEAGYEPKTNVDIDVIALKDDHLFILELKSTHIRSTLHDVQTHKNRNLYKAKQQLQKSYKVVNSLIKNNDYAFITKFGKPKYIHTWIVDTTFEFDHEILDKSLKISMFELIYSLNNIEESSVEQFVSDIEMDKFWSKHLQKPNISKESITYRLERIENLETNND